ncbi:biotin transporter BioY [Tunturiibacter gelidiferens]|uniref:biotin transporter BioY n=1 Tax=Tunturiibacter gelidiferens TaxID=3069689 RepID=UPI003D9AC2CE
MQSATSSQLDLTRHSGSLQESLSGNVILTVAASAFVGICAHISLPLPFTPVPLTLQNIAVILVGMLLGPVAGFSAMVLYLAEGAMGLPVFTPTASAASRICSAPTRATSSPTLSPLPPPVGPSAPCNASQHASAPAS